MKIYYDGIPNTLEALRKSKGLNLKEMGVILKCSSSKVLKLESGETNIKYKDLNQYCVYFHVPINYIVSNNYKINKGEVEAKRINTVSEDIVKFKDCDLYIINDQYISSKIIEILKNKNQKEKKILIEDILNEIKNRNKNKDKGDDRMVTSKIKNGIIPFKELGAFISVLNIDYEDFLEISK